MFYFLAPIAKLLSLTVTITGQHTCQKVFGSVSVYYKLVFSLSELHQHTMQRFNPENLHNSLL